MLPARPRYVSLPIRICSPTARSFGRAPWLANARVQRSGPRSGPEPLDRLVMGRAQLTTCQRNEGFFPVVAHSRRYRLMSVW
jgi:hypothetical protein